MCLWLNLRFTTFQLVLKSFYAYFKRFTLTVIETRVIETFLMRFIETILKRVCHR